MRWETTGVVIRHPECDVRPWLGAHAAEVVPYTHQRILQGYPFIDALLAQVEDLGAEAAYDVGCGAGYDTFAIGRYFDHVLAIDRDGGVIRQASLIAKGGGVSHVHFARENIERSRRQRRFDFIYCNLMSHNVSSRCALIHSLRQAMSPGARLHYSEVTEGYAPMEIHRAILARDRVQLVSRIWQALTGFAGSPAFRFFLAGSLRPLFEANALRILACESQEWNGMPILERLTARAETGTPAPIRAGDADYLTVNADLADVRRQFSVMLSARPRRGFSPSQRSHIHSLSENGENRFAPYLVFLLMADILLASSRPGLSMLRGVRGIWRRNPAWLGAGASGLALPETLDWAALEDLDLRFIRMMRRSAGLPAQASDD